MRKTMVVLVMCLFGLIWPAVARAEQFDNLIELPLDTAQAEIVDEAIRTEGLVLGLKTAIPPVAADRGPHFFTGETQILNDKLVGDVYVFAGAATINGDIDGDLLILGGDVTLNGQVSGDVRAGAGVIAINGEIGQNLTVGAGKIAFGEQAKIGNSVVAGGGEVSLNGQTLGRVLLGGGAAQLAGKYGSDVHAQADTLAILPGVVVDGSLIADAYTSATGADNAQVSKEKMVKVLPKEDQRPVIRKDKMKSVGGVLVKSVVVEVMMSLIIGFISGSLFLYFVPKFVKTAAESMIESPVASLGSGLVYLFLTPLVILLALVSIVAMPVAGIITLVYLLSLTVAGWVAAVAVGTKLAGQFHFKALHNPYWGFGAGLVVLRLVGLVPVLGWLVNFIAFLMGMGAIFSWIKVTILMRKSHDQKTR